ncbi:MAG: helix-turn-helix domain-containing protein [Desulfotomaculales bacterium]
MDAKKVFGQNVRRLRKRRGISQEELADRAGLHRTYIGSVERGERNISLENIVAIARALDVSLAELVEGICLSDG